MSSPVSGNMLTAPPFGLTLDEQGNGHYDWKDGRFETRSLIGSYLAGHVVSEGE